jgi:hypothetical protein
MNYGTAMTIIFHICKEDRSIIYIHDEPTGVHSRTTVFILTSDFL